MKLIDHPNRAILFPVAIVVSRFNQDITSRLLLSALDRLKEFQFTDIAVVWVPGAIEIPLVAQRMAGSGKYDAIIALGCVIRGETSHFDYVCEQVSTGCQQVALQYDLPVIFGILTTDTEEQALDRSGGTMNKGREAVDTAMEMVSVLRDLA